jgi:ribonuclease D
LENLYQVQLNKKFQKADWCRRPLTHQQLYYAQCDTHYLLDLRDHLAAELAKAGRAEEAQETFAEQSQITLGNNDFDPDGFWSLNGVRRLGRERLAILKALYIFRDEEARRMNRPHFKILGDQTVLDLAQSAPRRLEQLYGVPGMSSGQVDRYGRQLLQLIEANRNAPPPPRPKRPPRLPDAIIRRYEKLQEWRKQRANRRGVESDVIISRDAMWAIAQANPPTLEALAELNALGDWRFKEYGQELVALLNKSGAVVEKVEANEGNSEEL